MRPHVAKSRQSIVVAARRRFLRELLKMRKTLPLRFERLRLLPQFFVSGRARGWSATFVASGAVRIEFSKNDLRTRA